MKNNDPVAVKDALDHVTRLSYTFLGYEAFANQAARVLKDDGVAGLRREYSNRVIVVDEAHSLRSDLDSKRSSDLLMQILRECSNIKLMLMTATPMYDRPKEIVFLLNLLRANDKRPLLEADTMFDADGRLTDAGEPSLRDAVRGYVSFVLTSNPRLFPTVIPAYVAEGRPKSKWPKFGTDGAPVPEFDMLGTDVIRTELTGAQAKLVESMRLRISDLGVLDDDPASIAQALAPAAQASNVIYPGGHSGESGFVDTFSKSASGGVDTFEYRPGQDRCLAEPLLSKYAPKIAAVLKSILESAGITFEYTNWVTGGAIPMALALEEAGITRYGTPMLKGSSGSVGKYIMLTGRPSPS